ncbi:hypothetical protein ACS0TY_021680 [Phlomoides rotata]
MLGTFTQTPNVQHGASTLRREPQYYYASQSWPSMYGVYPEHDNLLKIIMYFNLVLICTHLIRKMR